MFNHTRHGFQKMVATFAMVLALSEIVSAETKEPRSTGDITVRVTAGDKRYALADPLHWGRASGKPGTNIITVLPTKKQQPILGFGAALTDAACYMINQMPEADREKLLQELFDPKQMGFSLCRLAMGSSDYAKTMYSYDEGDPDPELTRFSVDHDRAYILPIVHRAREINTNLYLFASPWSPPGWMKDNNHMFGGTIRKHYLAAYANYFVKFLQAYKDAGVEVNSISSQNEVDTDQDSKMPACLFPQEIEVGFVGQDLGPALETAGLKTKIWLLDHNYNLWGRAIAELDDTNVNKYTRCIAWHGYVGQPEWVEKVLAVHPEAEMYWTEGGQHFDDEDYATCWSKWSSKFTAILNNGMRGIIGWNMALDETGKPNIGPYKCAGLVTVNSETKEVTRSGQFWAFAHFARSMQRDAVVLGSEGDITNIQHVAAVNPDGQFVAVLTNNGKIPTTIQLREGSRAVKIDLPADSVTTLTWK